MSRKDGTPQPHAGRRGGAARRAGVGALGVVGGVLLALIVQDLLATALVRNGTLTHGLALVLGSLMPVFAVLGAVTAVLIDARAPTRSSEETTDD